MPGTPAGREAGSLIRSLALKGPNALVRNRLGSVAASGGDRPITGVVPRPQAILHFSGAAAASFFRCGAKLYKAIKKVGLELSRLPGWGNPGSREVPGLLRGLGSLGSGGVGVGSDRKDERGNLGELVLWKPPREPVERMLVESLDLLEL